MSRILVSVIPALGHLYPMLAIAEHLQQRGHEVLFNSTDSFRERVEASGLSFIPLEGNANFHHSNWAETMPELRTAAPGPDTLNALIRNAVANRVEAQARGIENIIAEHDIELIMTDLLFVGTLPLLHGPREARPPVIACGLLGLILLSPIYSPFLDSSDDKPQDRSLVAEVNRNFVESLVPGNEYLEKKLEELGVPGVKDFFYEGLYRAPDAFLQLSAPAFEYPLENPPSNFDMVGPILHNKTDSGPPPEWFSKLDGSRPIVLVTQGTIANFDFDLLINPAIQGLADEDVLLVVTAGAGDQSKIISSGNAIVQSYIPYELILPKAAVFLTNGGLNGIQQALSFGVPVVAAGATEDKPWVSRRVEATGTGINLRTGTPTPDQIRQAVREILNDLRYREAAQQMARNLAPYDALQAITEIAETMIAEDLPRRQLRSTVQPKA